MELQVIGTGSSGNCYVLRAGGAHGQALLLDAGLPVMKIVKAVKGWRSVIGCLITHEHLDHAKSAEEIAKYGICTYREANEQYHTKRERLQSLIRAHHIALEKLERSAPGWYNGTVVPLAESISKAIGMPYDIYGPFGLNSTTSVYFFLKGKVGDITTDATLSITVHPDFSGDEYRLTYDTGKIINDYPPGSLGYYNGMNNEQAPLPDDLESIVALLRREERHEAVV